MQLSLKTEQTEPTFQFLIGAIGSLQTFPPCLMLLLFQFLIGAIGSCPIAPKYNSSTCFNSLLVRLEEISFRIHNASSKMFQFLIGAIGSPTGYARSVFYCQFQFLIGAIGSNRVQHKPQTKLVSIPYWCDWKCTQAGEQIDLDVVSIPYWCDWKNLRIKPLK